MPLAVSTAVPDAPTQSAIRALAAAVEREDGAPPLSDQALTQLGSPGVTHVVVHENGALAGYGQRAGRSLEIVATPAALTALLDAAATGAVEVWSHGRHSRLVEPLAARGLQRARELHQLRRPLDAEHPLPADPPLADGVTVRAFEPGHDDAAWLALNAAAFASHPEQGSWTAADLQARIAAEWFDPAGFLLAERGGELVGFHWTKVHPDGSGEVYVLGVAPGAQGLGLGRGLLLRGLHHLEARGCPTVLLYVDGDNAAAIALYERAGFTSYDEDVQWASA